MRQRPFLAVFLIVGAVLLAAPYLYLGGVVLWERITTRLTEHPFDAAAWRTARAGSRQRGDMVTDLLRRYRFEGLRQVEVIRILGEPDRTGFQGYDMAYLLGPERAYVSIDGEWLVFRFDSSGRVASHALITD